MLGRIPRPWRLTYLGPEGTFTERALRTLPEADGSRLLPAATAARALELVHGGDADAAMLPVHNTVAGPVGDTVRALAGAPAPGVVREVVLPVEFALLVRPGTGLDTIRTVSGHPHAGAQVAGWLAGRLPRARWLSAPSNAEAARRVRDGASDAAVAGDFTAAHYGLRVAAAGIQDTAGAVTRFLLCAHSGAHAFPPVRQADRTSLLGRVPGPPDGLGAFLDDLRRHPLLRAVSLYTVPDGSGASVLFVDCPGNAEQPATHRTVQLLSLRLPGLRSLGSYASAPAPPPYERSLTTMHSETNTTGEAAPGDIARLRERIDDLDGSLIGTLKQRIEASREIQRIRTGRGGAPLDSGRELSIRGRYAEELGESGAGLAEALLEMCRGWSPR
ncbi:chorismate mutase [Streptomyces sp. NBC_00525]|uniref:chorismate mutase n=1 Tax=Streptomyces sp. NBC_00525 TaxID=2903660 RepID=UPI002E80D0B6|nr:chorismate mutase [Streptomyces sp. NBC_00525]WUC96880.1 chorismate mutase [Streptomyces sp. NBC_00525]